MRWCFVNWGPGFWYLVIFRGWPQNALVLCKLGTRFLVPVFRRWPQNALVLCKLGTRFRVLGHFFFLTIKGERVESGRSGLV